MWDYIYVMQDKAKIGVTENFRACPKEEYKIVVLEPLRYDRWDVLWYVGGHRPKKNNLKPAVIVGDAKGCI